MSGRTDDELSVSQKDALQALRERVAIAQRRSSRTKAVVLFGPDANVSGEYVDLKTGVAQALANDGGDYVNFEEHVNRLLEAAGVAHDPLRLSATALINYLYSLCNQTDRAFLVVDRLHTVLRLLREISVPEVSEQELLLRSFRYVMFPKPVVLVLPLFPGDGRWITRAIITQILGAEWKWVYLEAAEIDKAFLRERAARPGDAAG